MKGKELGILCGVLALGAVGCGHSPSPATAQYSYSYDFDLPLQPVETVVYTAAPVGVLPPQPVGIQPVGTTTNAVVPAAVPDQVRVSELEVPPGSAAPTVVPHSGLSVTGNNAAPAGAPSPVTRTGDGLPTPAVNIPVETGAPNSPQNVTTIVEPSSDGTSLERSTVVVDAPVKAVTNQTTTTETKRIEIRPANPQ